MEVLVTFMTCRFWLRELHICGTPLACPWKCAHFATAQFTGHGISKDITTETSERKNLVSKSI